MTRPCNRENMQKFVDALRSGKFTQGRYFLGTRFNDSSEKRYCCLGVACVVASDNGVPIELDWLPTNLRVRTDYFVTDEFKLPEAVVHWLGIESNDPVLDKENQLLNASRLNDKERATFAEIADRFERTYLNG